MSTSDETTSHARPPERIGQYRIKQMIAAGGMGTVFEAIQEKPRRAVALKIMNNIASGSGLRRFEYESQVLARLRHPGIAQILEAGTHREGRTTVPFYAMEYIPDAKRITQYANAHKLGIRERLQLFTEVCDAVHHGHQKGIIHRDLKPGNILVDGQGRVKIIDFGIARATDSDMTMATARTDVGQLLGTLQYMSPEQVRADPDDLDIRSDVYALGVILYELLCGQLPYDVREMEIHEAVRIIREQEPARPVTIARAIRGDIETITLKALEKDRTRRYQSADELGSDIRRYLTGESISARPPSVIYQVRVFARRNKAAFAAIAMVLLILVAASVFSSWQYFLAEAARADAVAAGNQAEAGREAEERQRKKAEAINEFVTAALTSSDPHEGGQQGLLVTGAMEQALDMLDAGELKDQPETEAALLLTISKIFNGNARPQEALRLARQSREIYERVYGVDHGAVGSCLAAEAASLLALGRPAEALPSFQAALDIYQRLYGHDHVEVATSTNNLAICLDALGRSAEALDYYQTALDIRRRHFTGDYREVAQSLNNVASCMQSLGRSAEALELYEEALEMRLRLFDGDHPDTASNLTNLANCLRSLGRLDEALEKAEAATEMYRRLFGGDHPDLATTQNTTAMCLLLLGRAEEALPVLQSTLEMRRRLFEGDHPDVATSLSYVGSCLEALGRREEALPLHEEALAMTQRLFKGDHPDVVLALNSVGGCLEFLGRNEEALPKFEAAVEMQTRLYGSKHPGLATGLNNLALCLRELGRSAEAAPKLEAALDILRSVYDGDHPSIAISLNNLGICLLKLDRSEEALPRFQEALDMFRRTLPPDHPNTLYPQMEIAKVFISSGRLAEAEPMLLDAAEQCERSEGCRRAHWKSVIKQSVRLYDAWQAADPGVGHDLQAAAWRKKLEQMQGG